MAIEDSFVFLQLKTWMKRKDSIADEQVVATTMNEEPHGGSDIHRNGNCDES